MAKKGRGRPSKLTPAVQERICAALAKGVPRVTAATLGGIRYTTLRSWELRGQRDEDGEYCDFAEAIKNAEAAAVEFFLAIIRKAATPHPERTVKTKNAPEGVTTETTEKEGVFEWTAAAWMLERRWADDFGRKESAAIAALKVQIEELKKAIMGDKAKGKS